MIERDLFKRFIPCYDKLLSYGFEIIDNEYILKKYILDNSFMIIISIINYNVIGKIIDLDVDCEYTNFRIENECGSFAGNIRKIFIDLLLDIRDKCFDNKMFVSEQANRIGLLIKDKYDDLPHYKWESTPDTGVFINKYTDKWYAIIMNVNKSKLSNGEEYVDVINIKLDSSKIVELLKLPGYYPAYHMNKKYWISIILDDTINDLNIMDLIGESYMYSSIKK